MKAFVRDPRRNDFSISCATDMAGIVIGTFLTELVLSVAALVGGFVGACGTRGVP